HETIRAGGRSYVVAGPWAVSGEHAVNPSYFAPETWRELALASGNGAWSRLRASARKALQGLLRSGLPPDWTTVSNSGDLAPSGPPGTGAPPAYGADAQRLALRYTESCDQRDARVASSLWPRLRKAPNQGADLAYALGGSVVSSGARPLGALAAAAAAAAANDKAAARSLLRRADSLEARSPTYYGGAWVAL